MSRRRFFHLLAIVLGTLALCSAWAGMADNAAPVSPAAQEAASSVPNTASSTRATVLEGYAVLKVVDGDTIDIAMNGDTVRLRLIGMDTPEVVDPRKVVQCFGKEASAEGHRLLEDERVKLEYDAVAGTYDKYGRMLAYVFRVRDGLFYNEYMIANGFAHEYTYDGQNYKYKTDFKAAQSAAQKAQIGFWSPNTCAGDTTKSASTT